jgi:hypothetical protein
MTSGVESEVTSRAESLACSMRQIAMSHRVHLHSLARRLGVSAITYNAEQPVDGCTSWPTSGGPTISLRPGMLLGRRRFTLAHELTHVMLGHGSPQEVNAKAYQPRQTEERLCDATAAALLMPRFEVVHLFGRNTPLSRVLETAEDLQVSLSALALRLNELDPANPHILLIGRADVESGEEITWLPPIGFSPPGGGGIVRVLSRGTATFDDSRTGHVCIGIGGVGHVSEFPGEGARRGNTIIFYGSLRNSRRLTG